MPENWPLIRYRRAVGYRLIPSKYPPIQLFEDVAEPDEFAAIYKVQALTNPRLRQSVGDLSLVEPGEMRLGVPGAGYIMAAFTHVNPRGSRFSDGSYGVYYCARATATAIAETVHHLRWFFAATREPAQGLAMRCLRSQFSAALRDVSGHRARWTRTTIAKVSASAGRSDRPARTASSIPRCGIRAELATRCYGPVA